MKSSIRLFLVERTVWIIAIFCYVSFVIIMPTLFLKIDSIDFVIRSRASISLVALGVAICLIAGSIDNSVPAIAGFVGVFVTLFASRWFPGSSWILLIFLALLVGGALGALNGYLLKKIRIHSFLITLVTYILLIGFRKSLYEGAERMPSDEINLLGAGRIIPGLSYSTIIMVFVVLLLWLFLNKTVTGLRIYATGGNPHASSLMGVDVDDIRLRAHLIAGILGGLAGLLYVGYNKATTPAMLDFNLFDAFAIAIFGGISLRGGVGRIEDVFAAMIFISTLTLGLDIAGMNVYLRQTVVGLIIIIGILMNALREKIRDRILMKLG